MMRKKSLKVFFTIDLEDEHTAQQLRRFKDKKLKFSMKKGPDIEDEHEKSKPRYLEVKFEPFIKFMKEVFDDM
eukprot:687759-Heterocapsa_arctica.AAC.1